MFRLVAFLAALVVLVGVGQASAEPVEWPIASGGNGHYYEYIAHDISWEGARIEAESRTYLGDTGHLVTIASKPENDFIFESVTQEWTVAGAHDLETEGVWKWVVGPEAGTVFWQGGIGTVTYAPWRSGEPNNGRGGLENYLMINYLGRLWNDYQGNAVGGYVVEFSNPVVDFPTLVSIANADWCNARTWSGDTQMPTIENDVFVAGHTVAVTENAAANSLQIILADGKVIVDGGATLTLTERFTMVAGSHLGIGVGGTSPGQVHAGSDVSLPAGVTLELTADGSHPFKAGTYTLITAGEIDGTFGPLAGLGRYVSAGANLDGLTYTDTTLTVTIDRDLHPGDANLSTSTDVSDFNIWNTHKFTQGTDWTTGDFDGDGQTDVRDFNIWNTAKFTVAANPAPVSEGQVPEPAALLMLAVAGLLLVWRGVCPQTLFSKETVI